MLNSPVIQAVIQQIEKATQQSFTASKINSIAGGDINKAYILQSDKLAYFIKLNHAPYLAMFEAVFNGLHELAATQTIKIPQAILVGSTETHTFLVLEQITFSNPTQQSDRLLGQQLAALHQRPQPYFGWHQNNTIGLTKQPNTIQKNWLQFWQTQRLQFQLSLALSNGANHHLIDSGQRLSELLTPLFDDYHPTPALLHGDLWGGNAAVTVQGDPIIYDPACYYGDRETDIAMTELFGGFSADFYTAYNEAYPLDSGYQTRKKLYNLYHILNHFNLFGGHYQQQAQSMIDILLSDID